MFSPSTVVTACVPAASASEPNAVARAESIPKLSPARVAGDTIGPAASCELDSVPCPNAVGSGGDDKLLRNTFPGLKGSTFPGRLEELLISALIIGGASSDGNSTREVGAADGSAVVALAVAAGDGVAASAAAALAIAAGGGVAAAGAAVAAAAVSAGGETGVVGSSFGFRNRVSVSKI